MKLAWSNVAKDELRELRNYSIERWGSSVARRYLEDVRDAARSVAADPRRAKPLKGPYCIARVRSHYLLVHVDPAANRLTIARVLHSTMDLMRHLP